MEAQRLGLEAYASDLNPVPVLINKAMIEISPKFAGRPLVNPDWQRKSKGEQALMQWKGAKAWLKMCATTVLGCALRRRSGSGTFTPRSRSPLSWPANGLTSSRLSARNSP